MDKQRLIDAEELKNQFKDYIAIGDKRFVEGMLHYRSIALGLIDNAPTIEAREHGRWVKSIFAADYYKCSECCAVWSRRFKFCPDCGARMDGGEGK